MPKPVKDSTCSRPLSPTEWWALLLIAWFMVVSASCRDIHELWNDSLAVCGRGYGVERWREGVGAVQYRFGHGVTSYQPGDSYLECWGGDYWVQYSVRKTSGVGETNLLTQKPMPSVKLITGVKPIPTPTPSATATPAMTPVL